jgi:hypothetical protein
LNFTKFDECYDKVCAILDNLAPGDRLPSVATIQHKVGYSRQKAAGCLLRWCNTRGGEWEREYYKAVSHIGAQEAMRLDKAARDVDRSLGFGLRYGVKVSE